MTEQQSAAQKPRTLKAVMEELDAAAALLPQTRVALAGTFVLIRRGDLSPDELAQVSAIRKRATEATRTVARLTKEAQAIKRQGGGNC